MDQTTMLPHMALWAFILQRKLRGYPLYDPPFKIEERLLPRDKAMENFDYFMRVKQERVDFTTTWFRRSFGFGFTKDVKGLEALTRWLSRYGGLLLPDAGEGDGISSYRTYKRPWEGRLAPLNLMFDIGILFGETLIANHPMLYWRLAEGTRPRERKWLMEEPGSGFQRPEIAGGLNPFWTNQPFSEIYIFVFFAASRTTWQGYRRLRRLHKHRRAGVKNSLLSQYAFIAENYPDFDPNGLRKSVSTEEYIELIDADDEKI